MRRTKTFLAGFLAASLAFSSAIVPVSAGVLAVREVNNSRIVAETSEKKLHIDGMYGENIHFTMYALQDDNKSMGPVFERFIPVSENGDITLPITDGKIIFSDLDKATLEFLNDFLKNRGADRLSYGLDLMDIDGDDGWIDIPNIRYIAGDYQFPVLAGTEKRDDIQFRLIDGEFIEWDKNKNRSADNKLDKISIVKTKEYEHKAVTFPEFKVEYEDKTPVEDGVVINITLPTAEGGDQRVKVKDGKITPRFSANTNTLHTIGIAGNSKYFTLFDVVNSNGLPNLKNASVFISDNNKLYVCKNGVDDFENITEEFTTLILRKITNTSTGSIPIISTNDVPKEEVNIVDDKTALGESSGAAVKGKRIAPGKDVKVADIEVVFEDGTKVPDGVTLDNFRMKDIWAEPAHYKVKDGKISGIVLKADEQYKLGFDVTNADYNNYEVVGAYKSKKLLRVYARYEGGVLLKYDYDEGIEAPEEEISKIVIKKTDGKPSKLPVSTSCLMNLILSDHGYQPQGVLPFRLVRLDNKKSTLIYSTNDGLLSLNGEAGVWYEMKLDKNPLYKLKDKTVFRFVLNKEGKYVALLKGYKNPDNLEGVVTSHYVDLVRLDGKIPVGSAFDTEECTTGQKYSFKDYKIIYNTKRALVKDIPVQFKSAAFKKPVKFEVYNATKQKVEKVVLSKNGKLSGLKLIVGNDYIISALDKEYSMKNAYVTISNDGKKLITSKAPYGEFKGFKLAKREKALTDEKLANRVPYKLPVYVLGNNKKKVNNVTLKFISPRETFEAKVVDGWVDLSLLEDTNYVMEVVKGNYAIDAFPLTVKDKSEFGAKKYVFNHLSCGSVQALYLINKKQAHKNDTTLVSSDGTTKVTGFRFGNGEYALSSRVLKNVKVPELKGKNYLVLDVDTVNMYRVELSPLAYGNFKVTTTVAGKKPVKNVYYIDGANKLQKVKFTQKGDKLTFNMDSMARYNTVIEYK